jgi:hypothetical protein
MASSCACPAESNLGDNGCEDINECLTTCLDTNTSTCTDSVPHETGVTHDCSCNHGYEAHESDVDICVDVKECDTDAPCTAKTMMANTSASATMLVPFLSEPTASMLTSAAKNLTTANNTVTTACRRKMTKPNALIPAIVDTFKMTTLSMT